MENTQQEVDCEPGEETLVNAVHNANWAGRHHESRFFKHSSYLI